MMRRLAGILVAVAACGRVAPPLRDAGVPDAAPPPVGVEVTVESPGRSATEIESAVTGPVEEALNGVDGVVGLTSESRPGVASLLVSIRPGTADLSAVREALVKVAPSLPPEALPPIVTRAPSGRPPIRFTLASTTLDALTLGALAESEIRPGLAAVPGVAEVNLCGGAEREVTVTVDPRRLAALGLTLREVAAALAGNAGDVAALGGVVLATRAGATVRLSDVATVAEGGRIGSLAVAASGRVLLGEVQVQAGAARAAIAARLGELRARVPAGVALELVPEPAVELTLELPPDTTAEAAAAVAGRAVRADAGAVACWRRGRGDRMGVVVPGGRSPEELVRALAAPGIQVRARGGETELHVAGPSFDALAATAAELAAAIGGVPGIAGAGVEPSGGPRPVRAVDPQRARALGVSVADASLVLEAAGDGVRVPRSSLPLRLSFPDGAEPGALLVPSAAGASVPLASLVRTTSEPSIVRRVSRRRAVTVWFRPGAPLSPASRAALRRRIDAVPLPPGVEILGGP